MTRTPFVVLLLAAGVTLAGAADPAQNPPPEKKPAAAPTAPKKETKTPATAAKTGAPAPKAQPAASKTPATDAKAPAADPGDKAAEPQADVKPKDDPNLGMSILGNQEAPKALVIVPWKSSEIGQGMGIQTLLDDSRQPIDKDVFMRVLNYFELRSTNTPTTTHQNGAKGGKS
ncbi:MAG TPA: hypothetical protein VGS03_20165 [Candidatus Polarisedimenticolia bacterium]|jgi:hypothetical protein|nr:hypothetical protein [Candidatus Polarisedimenticolia bacterium]